MIDLESGKIFSIGLAEKNPWSLTKVLGKLTSASCFSDRNHFMLFMIGYTTRFKNKRL